MWSAYSYSPQFSPQTYIVSPSVKGERVPVLKQPEAYNHVLAYLAPGTVIEVMFKADYWLYIVVPGKVEGYLYAPNARPLTTAGVEAIQEASAPTVGYKDKRMVTQDGITAIPLYFFLQKWGNLCFFVVSLGVLVSGCYLFGLGMTDCAVTYAGTACNDPFEALGAVLIFVGFFAVVYALCRLVAQLARRFRSA